MALLMPIVIKRVVSTGLTVTLKYDNHGGGQCCPAGSWDEVRDRLVRTLVL